MQRAKQTGKNRWSFSTGRPTRTSSANCGSSPIYGTRRNAGNGAFYQPIYRISDKKIIRPNPLLLAAPQRGMISPADFTPSRRRRG